MKKSPRIQRLPEENVLHVRQGSINLKWTTSLLIASPPPPPPPLQRQRQRQQRWLLRRRSKPHKPHKPHTPPKRNAAILPQRLLRGRNGSQQLLSRRSCVIRRHDLQFARAQRRSDCTVLRTDQGGLLFWHDCVRSPGMH